VDPQLSAAPAAHDGHHPVSRFYAWSVFALTFGLMLSDYLTRNVISAVFPMLKAEWSLTDRQLGSYVSVVALVVGVASFPIALLADRWGRVKSITAMSAMWCIATIGCGLAQSHAQMLVARGFVGLGEAGYGSAGGAILSHVFPPHQRSVIFGAFLAAALFGSVGGVALGGIIAAQHGWRAAFVGVGAVSLVLVVLYPMVVRDYKTVALVKEGGTGRMSIAEIVKALFAVRTAVFTYLGSGFAMFILGVLSAWIPTYFTRYYGLAPEKAAVQAAMVILVSGVGMIVGGGIVDRLGRRDARNKLRVPGAYALITFALLMAAFLVPPGPLQMALIFAGVFLAGGHSGATGAVIIDVVHPGLRATAIAVIVLGNNLIGFAPGPVLVGALSDAYGLRTAMAVAPVAPAGRGVPLHRPAALPARRRPLRRTGDAGNGQSAAARATRPDRSSAQRAGRRGEAAPARELSRQRDELARARVLRRQSGGEAARRCSGQ
jgi:MFS family permease